MSNTTDKANGERALAGVAQYATAFRNVDLDKIADPITSDTATAADLPAPIKLNTGPSSSPLIRALELMKELRNLEVAVQRAEQLPLTVCYIGAGAAQKVLGTSNMQNLLDGTHVQLDDQLSDLVQLAIVQRVETVRRELTTMGIELDLDTLMNLPTFTEVKDS